MDILVQFDSLSCISRFWCILLWKSIPSIMSGSATLTLYVSYPRMAILKFNKPNSWNNLPNIVKQSSSVITFKFRLSNRVWSLPCCVLIILKLRFTGCCSVFIVTFAHVESKWLVFFIIRMLVTWHILCFRALLLTPSMSFSDVL